MPFLVTFLSWRRVSLCGQAGALNVQVGEKQIFVGNGRHLGLE